jgi:hypothetical protein
METSTLDDASSASKKQKHGVACVPCAAAKTRCLRSDRSSSCERCLQLKKQCISQIPMPRKRKAGPPTTTRVAQLEQKLNGLVTLLTSQQVPGIEEDDPAIEQPSFRFEQTSNKLPTPDGSASTIINDYVSPRSDRLSRPSRSTTDPTLIDLPRPSRTMTSTQGSYLQVEDGRVIIDTFYTRMLPYFPFAVLEPDETVESLQKQKPFLWKVVRCIASTRDRKRQEALGGEIMEEISAKLLLTAAWVPKSLELLQGLILFAAWNHYQFAANGQMSTLLYFAKSVTISMGLDRAPGAIDRRALWMSGNPLRCHNASTAVSDRRIHTLAEQRAYLTCYYLVMTRVKLGGSTADIFHYTPYLEKCCQSLEATQECQSDLVLVYLVRLQHIVQEINQTFPYDESDTFKALGTPVALCIKALRTKLSTLRASLPQELERNPLFLMTFYSAELSLYEVALYDATDVEASSSTFPLQLDRLGLLHGCLTSVVAYFDVYASLSKEDAVAFPFTIWMQSGLAILTGFELAFLTLEGWDTAQVRQSVDITKVLDGEIEKLEETAAQRQISPLDDVKTDIFWKFAVRMRKTRELYDSTMTTESKNATRTGGATGNDIDMTATMDVLAGDLLNGWDESFWQTFVSDQWDTIGILGNGVN